MKIIKSLSLTFSLLFLSFFSLHAQPPREVGAAISLPDFINTPRGNAYGWYQNHQLQEGLQGAAVDSACIFRTQTQGGWGSSPNGNNPGAYLHTNFDSVFPAGIVVGCDSGFTLTLTTAQAVTDYLPAGGRPAALSSSLADPTGYSNNLASQLVALALTLGFDQYDAGFGISSSQIADASIASGTFAGWTVQMVFDEANAALGGCSTTYSASTLSGIVGAINESFVDGNVHNGALLACDSSACSPPQLAFLIDDTICDGLPFHIINQSQGVDTNATYYLDINNDGNIDLSAPASALPDDTLIYIPFVGEFEFSVIVVNSDGCSDTLVQTIEILPLDSCVADDFLEFITLKKEKETSASTVDDAVFSISAYPNPFQETVTITFMLSDDSRAKLEIFNLAGQRIVQLFEGDAKGGELRKFEFTPQNIVEGMYIYRLQTESGSYYGKAVMVMAR